MPTPKFIQPVAPDARPIVEANRGASLRSIAAKLTEAGITTPGGSSSWRASQVSRLVASIG